MQGGYGAYQGWQIRLSDDTEVIAKAKDSHAGLMVGMFVFFALGEEPGWAGLGCAGLLRAGCVVAERAAACAGWGAGVVGR
jgi:hypothetical protein